MGEVMEFQHQNESSSRISQVQAVTELLRNLEAYYGSEYNETQRKVITAYLFDLDPGKYSRIYGNVIRVKLYGARLPLVEHFEEAAAKISDDREYIEPMYRLIEAPSLNRSHCDPDIAMEILDNFYKRFRLEHVLKNKQDLAKLQNTQG